MASARGGVLVQGYGCDNPDDDPRGAWCRSNEGEGCALPHGGGLARTWWYYCNVSLPILPTVPSGLHACAPRRACTNTSLFPSAERVLLPWCLRLSCDNDTASAAGFTASSPWCPSGKWCLSSAAADQRPCPAGHYCPQGSAAPVACWWDVAGGAAERCPEGSVSQARGYLGVVIALVVLWLPLCILLETLTARVGRRADVRGRLKLAIEQVVQTQAILRAMRPQPAAADRLRGVVTAIEAGLRGLRGDMGAATVAATATADGAIIRRTGLPQRLVALRLEWRDLSFHIGRQVRALPREGQDAPTPRQWSPNQ